MKKIFFSILWGIGFYFASAMILAFMSGVLFFNLAMAEISTDTHQRFFSIYGILISILIWALGITGFIFGLFEKLPGTKKQVKN